MSASVAIFVDGDNLSARYAGRILREAADHGPVSVAKAYGNETALGCWRQAQSFQFVYSGSEKNATDVLMAIEVTEHVLSHPVRTVVLCSSDADFSHLARFVRARGIPVIGMGEEKTSLSMRRACSEFRVLTAPADVTVTHPAVSELDRKIRSVIAANSNQGRGMRVADLNPEMKRRHGTSISATPDKNWRTYFAKREALYELDPRGPDARVRFKRDAFA